MPFQNPLNGFRNRPPVRGPEEKNMKKFFVTKIAAGITAMIGLVFEFVFAITFFSWLLPHDKISELIIALERLLQSLNWYYYVPLLIATMLLGSLARAISDTLRDTK
ncbi:MAG: hypothetical protein INF43_05585 [Alphaproteobacteria bacterium]|nr:hypothetical protein [Alphaproteobacteria bacterium]